MSVLSSIVQDLVDVLVDQVKQDLREYANDIVKDLDALVTRIINRAVSAIVTSIIWALLISVGAIFTLLGMVTFLTPVVGPALAWALVGLVSCGLGVAELRIVRRPKPPEARRASRAGNGH